MAHKTLIGGTAYEIGGGRTLVNGTGYSIDKGKTLVGGTEYDINFTLTIGSLAVGSSVFFNVNGVSTEFLVVHQGLPSALYDDSCNGTWLLMKGCYIKMTSNTTAVNTYADGSIHKYLNETFLSLLDTNVQSIIKQIKLPYCKGGSDMTVYSGNNGLLTKIFILGGYEVGYTQSTSNRFPIDGAKLDYFVSGTGTSANNKRAAVKNGGTGGGVGWHLRSPDTRENDTFWQIRADGKYQSFNTANADDNYYVRPAFVFPSDFSEFNI